MERYVVEFDDGSYLALVYYLGVVRVRRVARNMATTWESRVVATAAATRFLPDTSDWRVREAD